jgi:YfiH family protein
MIVPEATPGVAFGTAADANPRIDDDVRRELSDQLGIPHEWAWVRQVHGADVVVVDEPGIGDEADAIVTMQPGLPIAVSIADCLPVAFVADGAVGVAHAGWKGAVAGVLEATIGVMEQLGQRPHTMSIGPGIGPCCFEVGVEVAEQFGRAVGTTSWGTSSVDLPRYAAAVGAGMRVVTVADCTHHDDRFHSYRRNGTSQRQFGVAWIAQG